MVRWFMVIEFRLIKVLLSSTIQVTGEKNVKGLTTEVHLRRDGARRRNKVSRICAVWLAPPLVWLGLP